jgi:CheY-like chemotaxis protein
MKRILLVDDNIDNLDVLSVLLEDEGFLVKAAFTARDIDSEIENFQPDIIFMDVMLGKENGIDICMRLKSSEPTSKLKIVLMTASYKFQQVSPEISLADYHLEKPFDINHVADIAQGLAGN